MAPQAALMECQDNPNSLASWVIPVITYGGQHLSQFRRLNFPVTITLLSRESRRNLIRLSSRSHVPFKVRLGLSQREKVS